MGNSDEHARLLGEVRGKLDMINSNVERQADALEGIEARIGKLEARAAVHGAVAGGVISVGLALVIEKIKHSLGIGHQ